MKNGKKFDEGKLRMDLVDPEFVRTMAAVLAMGAQKYGADNWQDVYDAKARYTAALLRHITAWQCGETKDPESGIHHLGHAACNLMFLLWGEHNGRTNVQRHEDSGQAEVAGSGGDIQAGVRDNDVQELQPDEVQELVDFVAVFDRFGPQLSPRTYRSNCDGNGSISFFFGSDYETQNHVADIKLTTLSKVQRLSSSNASDDG